MNKLKIVDIFAEQLYSFAYLKEGSNEYCDNEYNRLMNLWTDVSYLRKYAVDNGVRDITKFVRARLRDAEKIEDLLENLTTSNQQLEKYFRPLNNLETGIKILSLQKGKVSSSDGLRVYAIKIDKDCFVITGGAIKMGQLMKDHPDTRNELLKIEKAKSFLLEHGVFDRDSLYEFKTEWE